MQKPIAISALGLAVGSLICLIIGVATTYWYKYASVHVGLWKACADDTCVKFDDVLDWVKAVRALEIIAIILVACSCVASGLYLKQGSGNALKMAVPGIPFLSFLFCLIGVIIFAVKFHDSGSSGAVKLSWSFYITVVGCVLIFISFIMSAMSVRRSSGAYESI